MRSAATEPSIGFPPIAGPGIRTLVLGSLPSRRSLELGQYYGHPQNAFWRIMGELADAGLDRPYGLRVERLIASGIGVWDVLRASVRPGSLDADIDVTTAEANDFDAFLVRYPGVGRICFNGRKAAALFRRLGCAGQSDRAAAMSFVTLPSTSPAFASMPLAEKVARWSIVIEPPEAVR